MARRLPKSKFATPTPRLRAPTCPYPAPRPHPRTRERGASPLLSSWAHSATLPPPSLLSLDCGWSSALQKYNAGRKRTVRTCAPCSFRHIARPCTPLEVRTPICRVEGRCHPRYTVKGSAKTSGQARTCRTEAVHAVNACASPAFSARTCSAHTPVPHSSIAEASPHALQFGAGGVATAGSCPAHVWPR